MTVIVAQEMGQYLQSLGEGAIGINIFVDKQATTPDEIITIYDKGGAVSKDAPETWRRLYLEVRCVNHQDGYQRIWRILNYMLYPSGGLITVGTNKFTAELQEIPTVSGIDAGSRYLFGFYAVVRNITDVTVSDEWLGALASWTSTILTSWQVYKVWQGNTRPSVTWRLTNVQTTEKAKAGFEIRKKFEGQILGSTINEQIFGATKLVQELGNVGKLPLDAVNKRYLTVTGLASDVRADALTAGQVSVTLSRLTLRPADEAPLITAVHNTGNII